jgi:tRNA(adenine34) deaminase
LGALRLFVKTPCDEFFMKEALGEAALAGTSEDVPVGAVVVFKNRIIARAHNQVELLGDPTAHAEMLAITEAADYLKSKWLTDCVLYATIEPCSMCAGALVLARIAKVVFGALDPRAGAGGSVMNILHHPKLNHRIKVVSRVLETECAGLIQDFFRSKRAALN